MEEYAYSLGSVSSQYLTFHKGIIPLKSTYLFNGDQQVFLSKDVEFKSRQNGIDKTAFESLLSTEGKKVYCNMNVTQSSYIIKLDGNPIHTLYLYPEGKCYFQATVSCFISEASSSDKTGLLRI